MRRIRSAIVQSPAMAIAFAALLALSGGLAVAATSSSPVIRACANKKTGALRLASKCRRNERHVSWNQTGPVGPKGLRGFNGSRGLTGSAGAAGATGAQGREGQQGPGAISFDTTVAEEAILAGPTDGIVVSAICNGGGKKEIAVVVGTASNKNNLQASGLITHGNAPNAPEHYESNNKGTAAVISNMVSVEADLIVADSTIGKVAHVDVHGEFAEPSCPVWGVIVPSK